VEADHNQAEECGNFSRAVRLENAGMKADNVTEGCAA
jgi:hypothetical protein